MSGKTTKKTLSPELLDQLRKVAELPEENINTVDIPQAPAENWAFAQRSAFYKPLKRPVTIRLDADVLSWFKEHAAKGRYQTEINQVLRQYVVSQEKRRA